VIVSAKILHRIQRFGIIPVNDKEMTREEYLDYTIKTFQPYYKRPLTREDAQEITRNMVGFFRALEDLHNSVKNRTSEKQEPISRA
jgi:hypothetical protein